MGIITFDKESKAALVKRLQHYFQKELDQELGSFDAEFLLDFFCEEVGVRCYNQALADVQSHLRQRLEDMQHSIGELEKSPPRQAR